MNSKKIGEALYRHFANYDYKLFNSFVFGGWESDFFCKSGSGYYIEVEVKISRSDYFADFKKHNKHKIFEHLRAKKTMMVKNNGSQRYNSEADILIRNHKIFGVNVRGYYGEKIVNGSEPLIENDFSSSHTETRYIVNDWRDRLDIRLQYQQDVYAPTSRISYINLEEGQYPNQYWFAVPKGLIALDEVPEYAGLIWINDERISIKKKAPFMHKRKLDLTSILLKKYYNLWLYKSELGIEEKVDVLMNKKEER